MKAISLAAVLLIMYGYLCRMAGIYFFWESISIGWALLFIALIGLLVQRIKMKKMIRKKSTIEKIGIGIIIFALFIKVLLLTVTPFTQAYAVAQKYLLTGSTIQSEIGIIHGFSIIPTNSINKLAKSTRDSASATIRLIVKGEKKFKEVTVYLTKYEDEQEWKVEGVE